MSIVSTTRAPDPSIGQSGEPYRLLFAENPRPMWVHDFDTLRFLEVNAAAVAMYGYAREELLAMRVADIGSLEGESSHRRKDGRIIEVEIASHALPFGGRPAVLVVAEDVTARKQAERERTRELRAVNQELERFTHSISHDLRAPLRSIDGFSHALMADYPDRLDETGRDYLRRVRVASQRMAALVDDLLALSRLSRAAIHRERVSLTEMAKAVLEDRLAREPSRRIAVSIAEGLVAVADRRLVREVLEQLVDNAVKFTGTRAEARIEIGRTERDGRTAFVVRDNGVGFDLAYADRLFAPFQRLHADHEFPGTGIGLAIVHRIVGRHGGEVWVDATPDGGAAIYFSL